MKEAYNIDQVLLRLSKSSFRGSFHLKEKDKLYVKMKGYDTIERHAYDFITKRLAPAVITNDGKQTPMKGHPVFIAQHATATCCRNCLAKWHRFPPHTKLSDSQISYIITLIMTWIKRECEK